MKTLIYLASTFYIFFLITLSHSQCIDHCVCEDFFYQEHPFGFCNSDCECSGARICNWMGLCSPCSLNEKCPAFAMPCPKGTYQVDNICYPCGLFCKRCLDSLICYECFENYFISYQGICTKTNTKRILATTRTDQFGTIYAGLDSVSPLSQWQQNLICPPDTWAIGFNVYSTCIDFGIVNIKLFCADYDMNIVQNIAYTTSSDFDSENTSWQIETFCSNNHFLRGYSALRNCCPFDDNLGLNDLRFHCTSKKTIQTTNGCGVGGWTDFYSCFPNSAICGFSVSFLEFSALIDNTAVNDIRFICCLLCKSSAAIYHTDFNNCQYCSPNCLECRNSPSNCVKCSESDILSGGKCIPLSNYFENSTIFYDLMKFLSDLSNNQNWLRDNAPLSTNVFACSDYQILEPFSQGNTLSSFFPNSILPIHYQVRFKARFFKIDEWNYEQIIIKINGIALDTPSLNSNNETGTLFGNICFGDFDDDIIFLDIEFAHQSPDDLLIEITSNLSRPDSAWSISSITIGYYLCHASCMSCFGPSDKNCLSCYQNATLTLEGECFCNDGYFSINITDTLTNKPITHCTSCFSGCKTCYGQNNNQCSSCLQGFYLYFHECTDICPSIYYGENDTNTCVIKCKDNEYKDLSSKICKLCDTNCLTCNEFPNKCTKCLPPLFLHPLDSYCVEVCPDLFYGSMEIGECGLFCPNNYGFLLNSDKMCHTTCPLGLFGNVLTGHCTETCPDGYYADEITRRCEFCDFNCLKCSKSATLCSICSPDWGVQFDSYCSNPFNIQILENQTFSGSNFINSSIEENNWSITNSITLSNYLSLCGNYLLLGGLNIFGPQATLQKKYSNLNPHYKLRITFYFIKIDYWDSESLLMNIDGNLVKEQIVASYEDSFATNYCGETFMESIKQINVVISHNLSSLNLEITTSLTTPPPNSYEGYWGIFNISTAILLCDISCDSCAGPTPEDCLSCKSNKILKIFPGPSSCTLCTDGYYKNIYSEKCEQCNPACRTCSGPFESDCLSCANNFYLFSNSCVLQCPIGYWPDSNYFICNKCHESCLNCDGSSFSDCLSCPKNRYIKNGTCYEICPAKTFSNNMTFTCDESCPIYTYADQKTRNCLPCIYSCQECFGIKENECSKCKEGYYFQENSCVTQCSPGFYLDTFSRNCKRCTSFCKTCSSINTCESCDDGLYVLYPQNTSCVQCVNSGEILLQSSNICIKCAENCQFCENSFNCKICLNGYYLADNYCIIKEKITANLENFLDPQVFYLKFSQAWDTLFENIIGKNPEVFALQIIGLPQFNSENYNISMTETGNVLRVSLNFTTYISSSNILQIQIIPNETNYEKYMLEDNYFEIFLTDFCPPPSTYVENEKKCKAITYVTPLLERTLNSNVFLLSFTDSYGEIFKYYSNSSIITVENYQFAILDYDFKQLSEKDRFYLTIEFNSSFTNSPLMTLFLNLPPECIYNTSNSLRLSTQTLKISLKDYYKLSEEEKNLISNTQEATSTINSVAAQTFTANNMFPSLASFAFRCLISMDTIRFLRFFTIDYPPNVIALFDTKLPTSDVIPNVEFEEEAQENVKLPQVFINYEVSPYVFNNCGNNLIELCFYFIIGYATFLLIKFTYKKTKNPIFRLAMLVLKSVFVWNFAIINTLSNFMNFSIYTFLSLRFPVYNTNIEKFNYGFSLLLLILLCGVILFVFLKIQKLRPVICKIQNNDGKRKKINSFEMSSINSPTTNKIKSNQVLIEEESMRSFTRKKEDEIKSPKKPIDLEDLKSKYSNQENSFLYKKNESFFNDKQLLIMPESISKKEIAGSKAFSQKINKIIPFDGPLEQTQQNEKQKKDVEDNLELNTHLTLGPIPSSILPLKSLKEQKNDLKLKNFIKSTEDSIESQELREKDSAIYYKKRELYIEETLKLNVSNHLAFILKDPSNFILENKMEKSPDKFKEKMMIHIKSKKIQEEANNFFPFHKDYQQDSLHKSYFIIIELIRQSLYSLLIILFYDKPFLGLILILILNSIYVLIFVKIRPYKDKLDFCQNLFNEIILISVFLCNFILASMEKFGKNDLNLKIEIGWAIVIGNSILVLFFIIRMIFNLLKILCFFIKIGFVFIKTKMKKGNKIFDEQTDKNSSKPKKKEKDIIQNIMEIQNFLK